MEEEAEKETFIDKALYPDFDKPRRFHWVWHLLARIVIQIVLGYFVWQQWTGGSRFVSVLLAIVFVYLIVVVVWGAEIRQMVIDVMTHNYGKK